MRCRRCSASRRSTCCCARFARFLAIRCEFAIACQRLTRCRRLAAPGFVPPRFVGGLCMTANVYAPTKRSQHHGAYRSVATSVINPSGIQGVGWNRPFHASGHPKGRLEPTFSCHWAFVGQSQPAFSSPRASVGSVALNPFASFACASSATSVPRRIVRDSIVAKHDGQIVRDHTHAAICEKRKMQRVQIIADCVERTGSERNV